MKRTILILAFIGVITTSQGQTIKRDESGNFHAIKTETAQRDSTTNFTFTDGKGKKHKVYVGAKGKFYIPRVSKNGNFYRQYLKTED
jgi:hypothetical protein